MKLRSSFDPAADRLTETLRVGISLDAKRAIEDAARRTGQPVSGFVRRAVEQAVERETAPTLGARR